MIRNAELSSLLIYFYSSGYTKEHLTKVLIQCDFDWTYPHAKHVVEQVKYWSGNVLGLILSISPLNVSFKA